MDHNQNSPPEARRECSQKKCRAILPPESEYKWKTCQRCRDWGKLHKQAKRKNDSNDDGPRRRVVLQTPPVEGTSEAQQYVIVEDNSTSSELEMVSTWPIAAQVTTEDLLL
jgi:hypothetical protein